MGVLLKLQARIQSHKLSMINAVKCLNCNVDVPLIWVKKFGNFIACNKYPDCQTTFGLPVAIIKPVRKQCETCGLPIIKVIKKRSAQDICINPKCKSKITEDPAKIKLMEEIVLKRLARK